MHDPAQLKVNLRPVWSPAAEALSQLSERFDNEVWNIMFQEVQWIVDPTTASSWNPEWMSELSAEDDVWEEERSWRDPSAHKLRITTAKWMRGSSARESIVQVFGF